MTETKLICHGDGESYDWENVCKYDGDPNNPSPCTLENGQILELDPT